MTNESRHGVDSEQQKGASVRKTVVGVPPKLVESELRGNLGFLARRLVGKAGHKGVSSDALIACAATGSAMPDDIRPYDLGDFGRCCEAFSIAPYELRRRMLPQLVAWGQMLEEEMVERGR